MRTLIIYSSKTGTAKKCAALLAANLGAENCELFDINRSVFQRFDVFRDDVKSNPFRRRCTDLRFNVSYYLDYILNFLDFFKSGGVIKSCVISRKFRNHYRAAAHGNCFIYFFSNKRDERVQKLNDVKKHVNENADRVVRLFLVLAV